MPGGCQGEEGHCSMVKKSRCLVIRSLSCPIIAHKKVISGDNSYYGQDPTFKFFKGKVNVLPEPIGCQLPK